MRVVGALILLLPVMAARLPSADESSRPKNELEANWRRFQGEARAALRTNSEAALQLCDRAIAAGKTNAEPWLLRATVRERRREYAEAIRDANQALSLNPAFAAAWQFRGALNFKASQFRASVRDFDRFLELVPGQQAQHWQRGISLYYAGDYDLGAKQFELHETVNPDDVENDVWHYLCVARRDGVAKARAQMLKPGADPRAPMEAIYSLYAGKGSPENVLAEARASGRSSAEFYGQLYVALFLDAGGDAPAARDHIAKAVALAGDDYMGDVARVHARYLREQQK